MLRRTFELDDADDSVRIFVPEGHRWNNNKHEGKNNRASERKTVEPSQSTRSSPCTRGIHRTLAKYGHTCAQTSASSRCQQSYTHTNVLAEIRVASAFLPQVGWPLSAEACKT